MGYCVGSGCNLLWVTVWRVVVICYRLLWGMLWLFLMGYCVVSGGKILCVFVWRVVAICYVLLCGEWW